jgi:predicted small lipoprotein YifL
MSKRILKTILLMALVAATLLLTACGKKEPPAPTATPAPPPAHGYPNGAVSGQDKLDILNKLDRVREPLYIFEAKSRSKDVAKAIFSTYESDLRLDGKGYVRASGTEGAMKLTLDPLEERIYWKGEDVDFRQEIDALGQKGRADYVRLRADDAPQKRIRKAVSIPLQLNILKNNLDLLDMSITGDNVYITMKDTGAQDLKRLLEPQLYFVYYMSQRTGIMGDIGIGDTEDMLLEWVFNLSERKPVEISFQARTKLGYMGLTATCSLETFYRFGLVKNPEFPDLGKLDWDL